MADAVGATGGPLGSVTGAGMFGDAAQTAVALRSGGAGSVATDVTTDGLDLLGALMDPLGSLATAGVGWLIEHVRFLHEGLDMLAGNPDEVTRQAGSWEDIASDTQRSSQEYESKAASLGTTWTSAAGQAYQHAAHNYAELLRGASGASTAAAHAMRVGGALVGVERGAIKDAIAVFVGELIRDALVALASSWCTFGGSVAAFIGDAVARAGALAARIARRIAKLAERLGELARKLGHAGTKLAEAAQKASKSMENTADDLTHGARSAGETLRQALTPTASPVPIDLRHIGETRQALRQRYQHALRSAYPGTVYSRLRALSEPEEAVETAHDRAEDANEILGAVGLSSEDHQDEHHDEGGSGKG
jgi:uncharacterized protein YukE